MTELIKPFAEWSAAFIEALGIGIITAFAVYVVFYAAWRRVQKADNETIFQEVQYRLGRGILLGLEFLVAADIITTVAVELTFRTVGVLAVIVIVRTFLSFTLEVELTGRWPWQEEKRPGRSTGESATGA